MRKSGIWSLIHPSVTRSRKPAVVGPIPTHSPILKYFDFISGVKVVIITNLEQKQKSA